jgi:tetratricopeptide (TPR) repeat protein
LTAEGIVGRSSYGKAALLASSLLLTAAVHGRMPIRSHAELGEPFVPRPEVARATALGFNAVLSDYYWLRAVQIVGAAARPEDHATLLGRLIDVVTTLDPWVGHPYRFAAVWLVDSQESVREANRLLQRGIEHHPDDWRQPFYVGFNHYYYLGENEAAADAMERAATLEGSPRYLPRLVARLRAGSAGLETAAAFLTELARSAPDGFAKAEYEKALDEIETERRARVLDAAREAWRRRHGRDIERVADLVEGPEPVLRALPPELHGWEWVLDEATGRIVSSWYGRRYEPHLAPHRAAGDGQAATPREEQG